MGFSPEQQKKLTTFHQDKKSINIVDCEVKQSQQGSHKMEVMLKNSIRSTKKIDAAAFEEEEASAAVITLAELGKIQNFQRINVDVKVLANLEPTIMSRGKKKQDVIVADHSATANLTVWESYVYAMDEQSCYTQKNVVVREYASKISLNAKGRV